MASLANESDTQKKTEDVLQRFRDRVEKLRAEHRESIRAIRQGIEKRTMKEIKKKLTQS